MSRRARSRMAATQAKRINLHPQQRPDEDSFERAMAEVQRQLKAKDEAARSAAQGGVR